MSNQDGTEIQNFEQIVHATYYIELSEGYQLTSMVCDIVCSLVWHNWES